MVIDGYKLCFKHLRYNVRLVCMNPVIRMFDGNLLELLVMDESLPAYMSDVRLFVSGYPAADRGLWEGFYTCVLVGSVLHLRSVVMFDVLDTGLFNGDAP